MRTLPSIALVVAGLAFAAGCSLMDGRADIPLPAVPLKGSFEPPAPAVAQQATRFYVDDNGRTWDDRGRKHDASS
jgi:hypothetical protein